MATASGRLRTRLLVVAYVVGVVASVAVFGILATNSLQDNDAYGSILSTLAALGSAYTGIVLHLRRGSPQISVEESADALRVALLEQWEPEIRHRRHRFGDSRTIPLTWKEAEPEVADDSAAVVGLPKVTTRLKLDGRLDGNADRAADELAARFTALPGVKRLVVLGEPGAGKTFLGITLVVGLLRRRSPEKPVAAFFSLSAWDPVVEGLDDWIVRMLAAAHYAGLPDTPRLLLTLRMITPVLDGLDEMPEHVRRLAISRINDAMDGERSVVLTCRTTEYRDGLKGGAPVLLRAPVVEVQPVSTEDIAAHLRTKPAWADVVRQVERHPDGELATALSTPLMLSLFTSAYRGLDSAELLDAARFTTRHAIEDQVVEMLLETAYPDRATRWWSRPWTAKQARRWLTFLAKDQHEHRERDTSWWQFARRVVSWITAPAFAAASFAVLVVLVALPFVSRGSRGDGWTDSLDVVYGSQPMAAMVCGLSLASLVLSRQRLVPAEVKPVRGHRSSGFARGFRVGLLAVLAPGLAMIGGPLVLDAPIASRRVVEECSSIGALIAFSVVAGLGVGLHELLVARSASPTALGAGVRSFLARDRRSAWSAAVISGCAVGGLGVLSATVMAMVGGHAGQRVALVFGLPTPVDLHIPPLDVDVSWSLVHDELSGLVLAGLLLALIATMAMLATRTWTRFSFARVGLALSRNMPLRTLRFLADARERGILRGANGSYQFAHVRLQERLVARARPVRSKPSARKWRIALVGGTAAALLLASVAWVSVEPPSCRSTRWAGLNERINRMVDGADSGCFAPLTLSDLGSTDMEAEDLSVLAKVLSVQRVSNNASDFPRYDYVAVVGEFDQFDFSEWHGLVAGVVAAQVSNAKPLIIKLIYADTGELEEAEGNSLVAQYLTGDFAYYAIVNFGVARSEIKPGPGSVIGVRGLNMRELAGRRLDVVARKWVDEGDVPDIPVANLVDGISIEECEALDHASSVNRVMRYDVRSLGIVDSQMADMSRCGSIHLLVDQVELEELRSGSENLRNLVVSYMKDSSASIELDCQVALGEGVGRESMSSCLAVLAAAGNFRIGERWTSQDR